MSLVKPSSRSFSRGRKTLFCRGRVSTVQTRKGDAETHLVVHVDPLDLVRVRLLQLLPSDDPLQLPRLSGTSDNGRLHLRLLVGGESPRGLGGLLLVVSILVSPLDVLHRRLLEVLLDVVEGVLGDVGDSEVGVLLNTSRVGEGLSGEELDEGRLSGSVGSDDTDSGREGDGARDVVELGLLGSGVRVGAVGHLEDGTGLRSDTHEGAGRGEGELDDGGGEGVVGLGGGVLLDEAEDERSQYGRIEERQRRGTHAARLPW
jgi:hypothetical protein